MSVQIYKISLINEIYLKNHIKKPRGVGAEMKSGRPKPDGR